MSSLIPGFIFRICVFLLHENLVKQQDSVKKLPIKPELTQFVHRFKPGCVVISMVYQDDSVFCGTRSGTVIVYGRDDSKFKKFLSIKL